jgi:hypothetical protein
MTILTITSVGSCLLEKNFFDSAPRNCDSLYSCNFSFGPEVNSWKLLDKAEESLLGSEVPGCILLFTDLANRELEHSRFAKFSFDLSRGPNSSSRPLHCLPSSTVNHFRVGVNLFGTFSSWLLTY